MRRKLNTLYKKEGEIDETYFCYVIAKHYRFSSLLPLFEPFSNLNIEVAPQWTSSRALQLFFFVFLVDIINLELGVRSTNIFKYCQIKFFFFKKIK